MNNVQFIKAQLEAFVSELEKLEDPAPTIYTFSEDEMVEFVTNLHDQFIKNLKSNIENHEFSDDIVNLEFDTYSRTMEVSLDSDELVDEIVEIIDIFDANITYTFDDIYKKIK
jgi:hypothetical protein